MIGHYNANEVAMKEFLKREIDDCRCQLRDLGMNELVIDEARQQAKLLHTIQSIVPNAPKMYDDLKFDAP